MTEFLKSFCDKDGVADVRFVQLSPRRWGIYPKDSERADAISRQILASGRAGDGIEGHEFLRELGLVQHVFVLKIGNARVRIVSSGFPPRGMFSHLSSLERELTV